MFEIVETASGLYLLFVTVAALEKFLASLDDDEAAEFVRLVVSDCVALKFSVLQFRNK